MRSSLFFLAAATAFLSSCAALSPNNAILPGTPLKGLHSLRGGQNERGRFLRIHERVDEDNGEEERGGGFDKFLNNFRYQSKGAHRAEDLNQVTMARNYLQENPALFEAIRSDHAKRYETYSIWRGIKYHSGDVKRAMEAHGFDSKEVQAFVSEYKNFQPAKLLF